VEDPKNIEQFITEQKKRLQEKPECASALYNLGVTYMNQGKFDEAIEAFEESIDTGGRMFESFVNLGYIYFKEGDLEKVVKANLRAIEIEPRYARGYSNLGFVYLQMGED
jgi:tetratricopeptide (TPR) repeat protein